MEKHIVKIEVINKVTNDVLQIRTEKPDGFTFDPGPATEIAINKNGMGKRKATLYFHLPPFRYFSGIHDQNLSGQEGCDQ